MPRSRVTDRSELAPVHISSDATTLACVDGPELLVYEASGAPRWKHFCGELLVGVRATRDEVVTVDDDEFWEVLPAVVFQDDVPALDDTVIAVGLSP